VPIKKAELHAHLEGTITPELMYKLAERNKLPTPNDLVAPNGRSFLSRDFMHFLTVYDTVAAFIRAPIDYYDITFDYLKSCADDDAIYVELMYSPDHAEMMSGVPSIEHLHAIQQAVDDAEKKHDIIGRIIVTGARQFGIEAVTKVAENAIKQSVPCVTGFGLGGDEVNFPPKLFKKAYEIAAGGGLDCTVHAGEWVDASGMQEAMEHLPIKRIGHGVHAIKSPETIAMLKDKNIALEVCPTSNISFGIFEDFSSHPFPKLLDSGLKLSINSDDPPFVNTTLAQEYTRVQEAYQYSDEVMNDITKMAIDFAFVDEKTKNKLKMKI
jgi:adenosine deaminase